MLKIGEIGFLIFCNDPRRQWVTRKRGITVHIHVYTVYNEQIHINVSLIFIQIYSDITLLLIIINCNKIRPLWESNSIAYESLGRDIPVKPDISPCNNFSSKKTIFE